MNIFDKIATKTGDCIGGATDHFSAGHKAGKARGKAAKEWVKENKTEIQTKAKKDFAKFMK